MFKRWSKPIPPLMVTLSLLLSLIVSVGAIPAPEPEPVPSVQVDTRDYQIKLRSREFTPEPGLSTAERQRLSAAVLPGADRIHVFVQLHEIPSPVERATLAAQGIELLNYVPNRTWVAAVPAGELDRVAATPEVRWLGALQVEDKLAPEIRQEQFGDWHYDAERDLVAVTVEVHDDVALDVARDLVLDNDGMVRGYARSINGVVAELPRTALRRLAADDRVLWVESALPALTELNDGSRTALNVDVLHPAPYNASPSYNLDGTGIDVLVYDSGQAGDHPDFGTRLTHGDTTSVSDHSTHVAGTVGADGSESAGDGGAAWQWRGMAPNVDIVSYGFEYDGTGTFFYTNVGDIESDWDDAKDDHGADLGTASLGTNLARNSMFDPVNFQCAFEGDYGAASQLMDNIVRGSLGEPYIATWANGNERGPGTCGTQYNTTAPPACAKNPIHIGATNSNDNSMTTFSGWGPCDDGRLKPVIVAPGCQSNGDLATHSTIADVFIDNSFTRNCVNDPSDPNNGDDFCYPYDNMCGTSMATPAVAGILSLMLQEYRDTYNTAGEFLPSTAKVLLMNTAADLGNAGPDYQFGYGHVDAQAAVDAVIDGLFREGEMGSTGQVDSYAIQVPAGATQLQVSLAWDDPGAAPLSAPALVNDLDLALLDPGGGLHQPWTLNPGSPANAATTGVDTINNQEQVTVNAPAAGVWRVRVTGTAVPNAPQTYSLAATDNMFSLDIAEPTNAAPTNVGHFSNPEKLLVNLTLLDRHGGPLGATIDATTDLTFSIGGDAPSGVFPGGTVGDQYWVLLTPPTKSGAGCHDLQVTLFGTLTDTETNAVCYGSTPIPNQDVMLVIDSSGSMSFADKMPATKDAAEFFVTATSLNDMIGMSTFSTTAALEYPLTTVTGSTEKDDANAAVNALVANGWTAMGSGIDIANTELMTNGDPSHQQTLVVLSDGKENQTPMWPAVSGSIPADTVIHTVALGPEGDPDEVKLSNMASAFNGNYYRVLTGGAARFQALSSASLASDLHNVLADTYRSAAEETYGWERLWEVSDQVGDAGYCDGTISDTYEVYVEQGLSEAVFAMHWSAVEIGTPTMVLTDPNGSLVTPGADVEYRQVAPIRTRTGHEQYRISNPQNGTWTVQVNANQSDCSEYIAMLEARSPTELLLLSPQPGQHIGFCQNVPLLVAFTGPTEPILNAEVYAEITGPLTKYEPQRLSLFDDGEHGDGQSGDGWYGNTFAPCQFQTQEALQSGASGSYQIRIVGNGINENDEPVQRSAMSAYYASESTTGDPDPAPATILLVDDASAADGTAAYMTALDGLGVHYDTWDVASDGPVAAGNLTPYGTVIWYTGEDTTSILTSDDEAALTSFLENGGKLLLSSQNYFLDVGFVNDFMQNYLHVSTVQQDVGASSVEGVPGNAISDGLGPYTLTSLAEFADRLTPATPGGQSAFVNQSDAPVAVSFTDGSYCTLYAAFPLELLAGADIQEVMQHFLEWQCWDPSILVSPSEVNGNLWAGLETTETTDVSNQGQGKLAWTVNDGPIHLWAVTDADGEVPTFLGNLDPALLTSQEAVTRPATTSPAAVTDTVRLDVCTVTSGVSDCCGGPTCSQATLLDQDVLVIYSDQAFADSTGLGDMLADFVDQGGTVIVALNALVQGADGLGGRFMNENYSPLKAASASSAGAAALDTFDAGHPLMNGVSTAGALAHLDVNTTGSEVEIVATWDSGEAFVAIKQLDPAPLPGQVIAINAPLDDGQWTGDVDEIVTNAIQWLSDNSRNLPWLEASCSTTPPPIDPLGTRPGALSVAAVEYTCPLVDSGEDWTLRLIFDGSAFDQPPETTLRGKVTIEHNASEQERINIPVTAQLFEPNKVYLPLTIK